MKHGATATWFQTFINPHPEFPDVAVATLDAPLPTRIRPDWPGIVATARWRSKPGENKQAFHDRIRRDLAAERVTGEMVSVYERGGHFERNCQGESALIP